ncbi:uncharacterized protein LOC132257833 [Phlebotomus argentipes]|uniref:uncharacterized protein LOC132257833 n=1 Tax=Phlebotomus argentipes TaxID=94469 RepID=UPI0028936D2A|nr:uncharacterized protein LOC132257833 [Phlebotomus argentipes]
MLSYIILATLIPAILANTSGVASCSGNPTQPIQVSVLGCSQTPCNIVLGQRTGIEIIFKADRDIPNFKPTATAYVFGMPLDHTLPDDVVNGACKNLSNGECPIPKDTTVAYNFELLVSPSYPPTSNIDVDIALVDDSSKTIVCSRIRINAVKAIL